MTDKLKPLTVVIMCSSCGRITNSSYDRENLDELTCWSCGEENVLHAYTPREQSEPSLSDLERKVVEMIRQTVDSAHTYKAMLRDSKWRIEEHDTSHLDIRIYRNPKQPEWKVGDEVMLDGFSTDIDVAGTIRHIIDDAAWVQWVDGRQTLEVVTNLKAATRAEV